MIGVKLFMCSILLCLVVMASAFPADIEQVEDHGFYETAIISEESKIRIKRATCDLLSYGGKVNNSACAAHCLVKGFRGGWCDSRAVCNCRR